MAHVLIIDDEADIRYILETYLRNEGHTVDSAGDGKVGMRLAGLNHYDLVITDVVMPEMDGLEVITAIKRKFPDTRIIVMTGGSAKLDKNILIETAQVMRADKVVEKPLDLRKLKAAVSDLLVS